MREVLTVTTRGEASLSAVVQTLLARRADVVSLTAARADRSNGLRIHVVANLASAQSASLLVKQIDRNIDVLTTERATCDEFHLRRGVIARARADQRRRGGVLDLARAVGAEVVELTASTITLALFAAPDRVDRLLGLLRTFEVDELVDTGAVAIRRTAGCLCEPRA